MALTRPTVLPVWADAGDKVQPSNAELQVGWPLSNTPPARQRWNWLINWLWNGVRYLVRRGMPDWDSTETYEIGDRCNGPDGYTYKSLTQNTNKTPASNPADWVRWGYTSTELYAILAAKAAQFQVRVASTAAINLAAPGANIDGVAMVAGDRFLEKDNGTAANRGIYVWNGAAVPATRATDADSGTELKSGSTIAVSEGTANADTIYMLTTDGAITIGVTGLAFAQIAGTTGFAKTGATQTFTKGQAGAVTSLPATTGTVTLDLQASNNWEGTPTGNIILANPSSMPIGQSGVIRIVQGATPYTIAYGSYFKATNGSLPALTNSANAVDLLPYYVESATRIWIGQQGDAK